MNLDHLFPKYIKDKSIIEQLNALVEDQKIGNKIVDIFIDLIQDEKEGKHFFIKHNSKKVQLNKSLTTEERNQITALISKAFPFDKISSRYKSLFSFNEHEILQELNSKGHFVYDRLLENSICDSIIEKLEKLAFHTKKSTKKLKNVTKQNVNSIKGNTIWVTDQQDILEIPEVQKIAFDENLLNLVGNFLGSAPVLCQTNCWWSISSSTHKSNLSSNAQLFHQDTGYLKFLKVFIYLTDVNEENGPHKYVQGSSQVAQNLLGEDYRPSNRVEDEKVKEIFGEENIISFTGKKGTIIFEDTFGLHKGTPVIEGARLLLQLEYCNSLYFHSSYAFGLEGLNSEVKELALKHPRVFLNFTDNVSKINEDKFNFFNHRTLKQKIKDKLKSYL